MIQPTRDVDVAIIGAGFCGTMLAVHLARSSALNVALFERDTFARGVAYATDSPRHLLNLRAGKMSAFPDRPNDFADWLQNADRDAFLPRAAYAPYLSALLKSAGGPRLRRFSRAATSLVRTGGRLNVTAGEVNLTAEIVVLALGVHPPSHAFIETGIASSERYVGDPWSTPYGSISGDVLLVGTGLTAVDVIAELQHHRQYGGNVVGLSRHGLWPQQHENYGDALGVTLDTRTPRSMLRSVRNTIHEVQRDGGDWRAVIDGIRPLTQAIWQRWTLEDQRQFLRHVRSYWETRRRRVPPGPAAELNAMQRDGRLRTIAGRIARIQRSKQRFFVEVDRRGGSREAVTADWIVNCTGPQSRVETLDEPLVQSMLANGIIQPHPTGIGIKARADGRAIDANGNPQKDLFAVGSLMRGVLYESVSVPELSVEVERVARDIVVSYGAL